MAAESSKLASKKTDKKSKRKAEEDSAVEAPIAPSPSKGLKRKKSAPDVLDATHVEEADKAAVKSRKDLGVSIARMS
jgi:hypothetical protein